MTEIVQGTLRMLGDRILLKPLDWDASRTIIAIRHGRPVRGEVIAVGPGCYPNRYRTGKKDGKDYRKSYATKGFRPTEVKPGDIIELGGLNIFDGQGYIYQEVVIGTETHLIVSEKDVAGVRDDVTPQKRSQSRYIAPSAWETNVDWAYERHMAEALDGRS